MLLTTLVALLPSVGAQTSSDIGHWEDQCGLPEYHYTGALPFVAYDGAGKLSELPEDPYFLAGNSSVALVAHVSGIYELMTADRVWARANASRERPDYGSASAVLAVDGKQYDLLGVRSCSADPAVCKRSFGAGFADYAYALGDVTLTRTMSVAPSETGTPGAPYVVVDVELRNSGDRPVSLRYSESMPVAYVPMYTQMMTAEAKPVQYIPHIVSYGDKLVAEIEAKPTMLVSMPSESERTPVNYYPGSIFMRSSSASLQADAEAFNVSDSVVLGPGETRRFSFAIGFGDGESAAGCDGECSAAGHGRYFDLWRQAVPDYAEVCDSALRRELVWDAIFIKSSAKYNSYYDETFISQGTVYSYHFGDNIAARDLLQASLAACYLDPALAKSSIRYVLKHTDIDGEIKRGDTGYGYSQPTIYQESDPQIYVFQAVGEYLRITGDYAFLDEEIELYPVEAGHKVTVYDVLVRHFCYLRDVIGLGSHGLIKLMNSDWSDSFLHKYSPNVTLWSAESHLNSAMALAVMPEFVRQMAAAGKAELAEAVSAYKADLLEAFLKDMKGRKFARRAYLEHDVIGEDVVCIEPHSYLFAIEDMDVATKRKIYKYVYPRIADPTGLRTRERPLWSRTPGGEDGGIWFSLEYPLLLGVATFDPEEAWRLLKMFSFDNYTAHYPAYWIGQWTAPDELDPAGPRGGLYANWTGMKDCRVCFQGFCNHPHTWQLYSYYKLTEIK